MNTMEIKKVDFLGDTLIEARDEKGDIWVGVSYVCNGIGFTKHQKDRQVAIVQSDKVLKRGCLKFEAGVFDQYNETIAIKLDYLPIWLAKIPITPSMETKNPQVADKLEQYQLKAKDVLASAFFQKSNFELPSADSMATLNETVKLLLPVFDRAGMPAPFQALAMKQIYRKAGIELPVESLKAERELYDIGTIARKAGVYALSGKPHVQAVGCILRKLEIPEDEKELVSFEKNGHMGTTYQYTENVAELVKGWVKAQGFPEVIASDDGTRQYKVNYEG